MKGKCLIILAFVLVAAAMLPMSTAASPGVGGAALIVENIPSTWEGIALIVTLVTITAAALVYMLAGLINSPTARTWSRMQIYEALLSIAILLIFSFFVYLLLINPKGAFNSLGLLPGQCSGNNVNDLFTLASCDLATFNNGAFSLAQTLYVSTYAAGFAPGFTLKVSPIPLQPFISVSVGLPSLLSSSVETAFSTMFSAILFMLVLNQVQLLIISGSLLFLFTFFVLGIIARTFGFSRSFGGVLIAFAIGIGIIYPLLVSLTYGFEAMQLNNYSIAQDIVTLFTGLLFGGTVLSPQILSTIFISAGYFVAGLTFIPFLNFLILDAFIVDFSKSIGEKIDFMSLLTGLV